MKKNAILYIGVVLILAIFLLLSIFINRKESKPQEVQSTTTDVIKSDFEDISGDYISSTGEKATVAKNNQNWRISYNTDEGNVFGDFSTDWKEDGNNSSSVTEFNKSDGNKDFKISILINNNVDDSSKILKVITLSLIHISEPTRPY